MTNAISFQKVKSFVDGVFGKHLHEKRLFSLSTGVLGAIYAVRLGSAAVGRALAAVRELHPKHAIKQIDRLVGNKGYDQETMFQAYILWVIGSGRQLLVSLDWTEYGGDSHSRIALNLVTRHGRATPLLWKTVMDKGLKHHRNAHERDILVLLKKMLPVDARVVILSDRGFMNTYLYHFIRYSLGWDYVARIRKNTFVSELGGRAWKFTDWIPRNGRIVEIENAQVTIKGGFVSRMVGIKKRGMKEPWCLLTSLKRPKEQIVGLYSRRFTCEEQFRDEKDDRFGLGFKETRVSTCRRRDFFLLINALATILLTVLGAAGEMLCYDRYLRANTLRKRTHSLFRQGREYTKNIIGKFILPMLQLFDSLLNRKNHYIRLAGVI